LAEKLKSLVIICGGTGGHFLPGLSIAREFIAGAGKAKLLLSGKNAKVQSEIASGYGVTSQILPQSKPPVGLYRKFLFLILSIRDVVISMGKYRILKPDAVLAMGSFNCIAPALAAKIMGIPLFLHDGNARAGKANIMLSKYARTIFLSFPPVNSQKFHCPFKVTGMPLRQELLRGKLPRAEAIAKINDIFGTQFTEDRIFILVFGGSQGASSINTTLPEAMIKIAADNKIQAVHISGYHGLENVTESYSKAKFPHLAIESSKEMNIFYSAADFLFCRSGGSTIAELAFFAKFAILMPYPHASENHQEDNAIHFLSSGDGLCIHDSELNAEKIRTVLEDLISNKENYLALAAKAASLAKPDASKEILRSMDQSL